MLDPHHWQLDSSAEFCGRCSSVFTMLRRRHHCRHCGGVFCSPCSEQRLWLRPWKGGERGGGGGGEEVAAAAPAQRATTVAAQTSRAGGAAASAAPNTTSGVAALSTFSSFASQTLRQADENSFLSEASVHGGASLGSVTSEPPSTSTAASAAAGGAAVLTPVVSPLTADVTAEPRRSAAVLPSSSSMSSAPPPQPPPPRGQARRAHRAKVEAAAEGSRSSAVGLTSSSTEPDPHAEESATAAADASRANAATPGGERAVGGSGVGSRQASDALFAVSACSVSPTTAPGETSPQTWMNYNNNSNSVSTIAAASVSSPPWSHRGRGEVSSTSEALAGANTPGDEGNDPTSSRAVPFWQAARTTPTCSLPATGAVAVMSAPSHSAVDGAAYAEACYRREMDAHHLVWYLCRVCVHCYDTLLDAILDAHEHTSPQLPQQAAQGETQPLWQYVRLCSSAQSSHTRSGRRGSGRVSVDSPLTAPTRSSPSLSQSTPTRPLLSSAWARLCASVSLPATPVTPLAHTSPLVVAATAESLAGDGCVLPPPALRPQDLRRARETAQQQQHLQLNQHQRPLPVTADCGKAPGVPGLAMRLNGAHPAANSTAAAAVAESSRYSSPTSAEHLNEASVLSVSSAASFQLLSRQSTDASSPRQPQQARAVRSVLTPPRRRLISIGKSSGHVRQAVAIARRRRRIAVLLVDEREVEADAVCSPFGSPLVDGVPSTPSFAAVAQALGASATMATPAGTALPDGDPQSSSSGRDASAAASAKPNSRKSPPDGQRTNLREGSPCGVVGSSGGSKVPSLSIMVDFELDNSTDAAAAATLGAAQPLQQEESCAVHGLCSGDWLRPFLPAEATVTGPSMENSFTMATTHASGASPRVLPVRDASLTPAHPTVAFTSRPISCAGGCATACSSSTSTQAVVQSGALHPQQQQQSPLHTHLLPAVTVVPGSGACVLNALFRELGAASHRATTPATPVLGALTPTASAAAAAAVASSSLFMDPTLSGSTSSSGWGTGPESYVAQRHALVREMVLRQHRSALLAAAAAASSTNSGGGATSPGAANGGSSLSGLPFSAAAVAASGVAPGVGGVPHISGGNSGGASGGGGGASGGHERVTAPVNVFFQLRSPTDTAAAFTTTATASASSSAAVPPSSLSVSVLPVTSQVELIGIPVDATTAPATTSPKSALSPTAACSGSRTGPTAQPVCCTPGANRPFTLTELLPQLAKLSTNLDGYVVIVLRCASRWGTTRATTTISPLTAVNAAAASEESPLRGIAGAGAQIDKQQTAQRDDESRRERSVRLERDASIGSASGGGTSSAAFTRLDSAALQNSGSYSGGAAAGTARRRRLSGNGSGTHAVANNADAPPHRRHRVTDFFGGPQLRLLYQQLQCCGVAQPAISVIDVCDDGSAAEEEGSPGTVVADVGSPVADDQLNSAPAAAQGSPAEAWHGSPLSPAAPSPLSSRSTSQLFLVPTRQRVPAAAASGTESSGRRTDKQDALDKLLLPSSLNATREPSTSTVGTGADATAALTAATVNNNNNTASRRELQRRVAQEHAANSLRITAQQLGLPISRVHYPTRTAGNTERVANGTNSGGSSGSGSSTASSAALLTRGLESLVATMVYRDLSAQQQ